MREFQTARIHSRVATIGVAGEARIVAVGRWELCVTVPLCPGVMKRVSGHQTGIGSRGSLAIISSGVATNLAKIARQSSSGDVTV
jgi:hypothetical protein